MRVNFLPAASDVKDRFFYRVRAAFCQMYEDLQEALPINWDFSQDFEFILSRSEEEDFYRFGVRDGRNLSLEYKQVCPRIALLAVLSTFWRAVCRRGG
jgi:hypothetical protein